MARKKRQNTMHPGLPKSKAPKGSWFPFPGPFSCFFPVRRQPGSQSEGEVRKRSPRCQRVLEKISGLRPERSSALHQMEVFGFQGFDAAGQAAKARVVDDVAEAVQPNSALPMSA
jgi:hypothetical protein